MMSTFDSLPIILVSAVNDATAVEVISELIDNEVSGTYCDEKLFPLDRVWRIENKYYTVDVRLHALGDERRLTLDPERVEAHVIHVTEHEMSVEAGVPAAESRARAAAGAGTGVRVLLADAARAPAALLAWAAAARAEPAPLREPAPPEPRRGPFPELYGWRRARAALHAHAWPGLRRARPAARAAEGEAVERAEQFAAALAALGPALEARGDRDRAEAVVRAFCRALALDPDAC